MKPRKTAAAMSTSVPGRGPRRGRCVGSLCLLSTFLFSVSSHSASNPSNGAGARPLPAATKKSEAVGVQIEQIEIEGVTRFGHNEIESALEVSVGDLVDRSKVIRSAKNLQELYRSHGYEEMKIKGQLKGAAGEAGQRQTVLQFVVNEGLPTRVAKVILSLEGADKARIDVEALRTKSGFVTGDLLEQEKIAAGKRALQDALASEEYVGVKVENVKVLPLAEGVADSKLSAARWVALEFRVDLGDRVSFGFRENTVLSKSQLLALIEEQRLTGFGKDYVGAIRARIEDEYRAAGYANIKVVPYTFERPEKQERHVTYQIIEGSRVLLDSINFDGNRHFTNQQLQKIFFEKAPFLTQKRIYVDKELEKTAELVVEWIKSQGFLSAKLVTINRNRTEDQKVRLVAYLYEGERTLVGSVTFNNLTVYSALEVKNMLGVSEDRPLNLFQFNEGLEALKAAYRSHGYLDAKILNEHNDTVIRYSNENAVANIQLDLFEGPQYRISRIECEGLGFMRDRVIKRELSFAEGDVVEEQKIVESEARLRKLGIFSVVTIRTHEDLQRPGYKVVRVSVQEGLPGVLGGGLGYRNDLGLRAFGQVAYTNVWHRNHTIFLNTAVNKRFDEAFCANTPGQQDETGKDHCFLEYQMQLGYTWPWFALGETTFRPRLNLERTQFINFDASTVSLTSTLERRLLKSVNLTGNLTYSLERVNQFNSVAEVDDQTLTIGALVPSLYLDLRDNSLAPTSGFYSSSSFEWASPALLSRSDPGVGYTRFQFRADGFIPLAKDVTWYLSFRTGIERNSEPDPNPNPVTGEGDPKYAIPLIKLFALGGQGSLRGYQEQELHAPNDRAIAGTLSYVNYRTQIDLPFAGAMRFGPFIDAANLLVDDYSLGMLRYGAGVGFHYQSPVGPVNFDWGFKISPRPGEDPYRFHFSIGLI